MLLSDDNPPTWEPKVYRFVEQLLPKPALVLLVVLAVLGWLLVLVHR
jgi:hypothetical protein